jgi:hypothetical protein
MNQTYPKKHSNNTLATAHVQLEGPRPPRHHELGVQATSSRGGATSGQDDEARMANEGGTEGQVGDRSGPGAGYDGEPVQVKAKGGVS